MHSAEKILARSVIWVLLVLGIACTLAAQSRENAARPAGADKPASVAKPASAAKPSYDSQYVLGPGDQVQIWALGVEEITDKPVRLDPGGNIDLPMLGRIHASGLSVEQLREDLLKRLAASVKEPMVSIDILEFGSQPVSVIGAVTQPGVHQLQGRRTLAEVLSLAGGTRPDAGSKIKITRAVEYGEIPLPGAALDSSGRFHVAELNLKEFLAAGKPENNILIFPHDVITVPQSEVVYVVGAVHKAGGFTLNDRSSISVLQAVALAEGLGSPHAAQNSRIIRSTSNGDRQEIPVDLKKVLAGKANDVALQPNDILFVPGSTSKAVAGRVLETTLQTISGLAIWGGL